MNSNIDHEFPAPFTYQVAIFIKEKKTNKSCPKFCILCDDFFYFEKSQKCGF